MRPRAIWALIVLCVGCAAGDKPQGLDAAPVDTVALDGPPLLPCETPGEACTARDPCAIDPVCGDDHLCRPNGYQDCSDELECTIDRCGALGSCEREIQAGFCAISVVRSDGVRNTTCVAEGALDPQDGCQVCDPSRSTSHFSPRNGGACEDGDPCTTDDYCQDGACKGTRYDCNDGLACTDDRCDGVGGCDHALQPGFCMIDGACYDDGVQDSGGCGVCDASSAPLRWTSSVDKCRIAGRCYDDGATESSHVYNGCGICALASSADAWSAPAGQCMVGGTCVAEGKISPSGCGQCVRTTASTGWTPVADAQVTLQDFEVDLGGFTVTPPVDNVGWTLATGRAHSGAQALYYGDPVKKNYEGIRPRSGRAESAPIALPAGQQAALLFWLWLDVSDLSYADELTVEVDGQEVWRKSYSTIPASRYKQWAQIEVPLTTYAGQSVQIAFVFDTSSSLQNGAEGVYIDDVQLLTQCGEPLPKSPFVLDGYIDTTQGAKQVAGTGNQMLLHAAYKNGFLYLASGDAGEGSDHFLFVSADPPSATLAPAPWDKVGTVALGPKTVFVADENDNSYSGLFRLGTATTAQALLVEGGYYNADSQRYGVYTSYINGGVMEAYFNVKEVFGSVPASVTIAIGAYGTNDGDPLYAQTPVTLDSDGNIDAAELLQLSLPDLQVIP